MAFEVLIWRRNQGEPFSSVTHSSGFYYQVPTLRGDFYCGLTMGESINRLWEILVYRQKINSG